MKPSLLSAWPTLLALFAASSFSRAEEKEKLIHMDYPESDWRDVAAFYGELTHRDMVLAADAPKFLRVMPAQPLNVLISPQKATRAETVAILEKAFSEQLGIMLTQEPDGKTFTVSYQPDLRKQTVTGNQASYISFVETDWHDTLRTYQQLIGMKVEIADEFTSKVPLQVSLTSSGEKSKAISSYETALLEQCGILLLPSAKFKTVTVAYVGIPERILHPAPSDQRVENPLPGTHERDVIESAKQALRDYEAMAKPIPAEETAPPAKSDSPPATK